MLKQPLSSGEYGKSSPEILIDAESRGGNPFPGLRPFSLDECHLFFGRESQADEILVKLAQNRFVTVMGYSGSGKSSLMHCGLIPVLYGGFMAGTSSNWIAIIIRPGDTPLDNLTDAIVEYLVSSSRILERDRIVNKAVIGSILRSGPQGLIEVSRYLQDKKCGNIFFFVDQFEEIFRLQEKEGTGAALSETQQYVNLLLTAAAQTTVPVYVALTIRSDFIGGCSVFPALIEFINQSNYFVPQMTREQKRMIIEGPVAVGGGKISQRLLKRLLTDVGNDQDQVPILQHALMRTWDYWVANREPGEPIDIRHYNAVGRIHEALSLHANEAYDELNTRQKEIAEILFKNITEKSQDNKGMRRPARLGLVRELAEAGEEDVVFVINHFRKPGLSLLMPAANVPLNNDSMIELSHESLMRIWKRLDTWVDEEFESAQMYKRLSEAAAMYQIGKTGLWRPPDLQLALNWQKKQRPTREWAQRYDDTFERAIVFLDTSRITYEAELRNQQMMQRRELRRTRATAVILGAAFVVAIVFFVLANIQKIDADSQRVIAEAQRLEAEKQTELAESSRVEAEKQRNIAIQREADRAMALGQVEETLVQLQVALLKASIANKQAENNLIKANTLRDTARVQHSKVLSQYAEQNLAKTNQLYMLAIARNLATKSVQVTDDRALAGLLAMQGYLFHKRNNGKPYDPYLYDGLYSALTRFNKLTYNSIKTQGPPHVHIKSIAVSSNNNTFYASGANGKILKGDYRTLRSTPTGFSTPHSGKAIALSKDERYLANGSDSSYVQIYDLNSKRTKPLMTVTGLPGATNHLEFLPDGSGLIVSSADKSLSLVDHQTGSVKTLVSLPYEAKNFNISPDGKRLAGGTWSGQVIVLDLQNRAYTVLVDDSTLRILSVKFSPDGKLLAYGLDDKTNKRGLINIHDFATREVRQFFGHREGVNDIEFSPDGKLLASAGADKRLLLWLLDHPEDLPVVIDNNNGVIWDIAFSSGSQYLMAACSESEIRVWPTDLALLAEQICPLLKRNMTQEEWKKYVGDDEIKYELTCTGPSLIKDH